MVAAAGKVMEVADAAKAATIPPAKAEAAAPAVPPVARPAPVVQVDPAEAATPRKSLGMQSSSPLVQGHRKMIPIPETIAIP